MVGNTNEILHQIRNYGLFDQVWRLVAILRLWRLDLFPSQINKYILKNLFYKIAILKGSSKVSGYSELSLAFIIIILEVLVHNEFYNKCWNVIFKWNFYLI